MLKPILSKDGNLQKLSPHVYHTIIDNSRVAAPTIASSGYYAFFPVYTDKGPTNEVRTFNGAGGFANILETYGKPNAKKYGLPYSAAIQHARLGGAVTLQSIKSPGASHAAVVVVMKIKQALTDSRLGWVLSAGLDGRTLRRDERGNIVSEYLGNVPIKQQFLRDETDEPKETIFSQFYKGNYPNAEQYIALWKEVRVRPIEITFESIKIDDLLAQAKKAKVYTGSSVSSWTNLEALVNTITPESLSTVLNRIETTGNITPGNDKYYSIPILWGMCTGKGKYGNYFSIKFANTTANIEGRPILKAVITDQKTREILPDSEKSVSFSNDFGPGGVPLLLDAAYSAPEFKGDFKFATSSLGRLDDAGLIVQEYLKQAYGISDEGEMLFKYKEGGQEFTVTPLFNVEGQPSYGSTGDLVINEMKKQIALLDENDDSSFHRLSYLDFTRLTDRIGFVKSAGIDEYVLNGGHEGELRYMKEFNWDFNFEDPKLIEKYKNDPVFNEYRITHGDTRIVEEMFIKAFSGKTSKEIYSIYANPADYVIDCGYPDNVKTAIAQFGELRDEIQLFLNTRTDAVEINESIRHKNSLNYTGRNVAWYPGNFEWVDPYSSRSVRVPQTFAMIPNILAHFENGYDQALAGTRRGLIQGVIPFSGRGYGSTDIDENDKLITSGLNILSAHSGGQLYVDSQLTNYEIGSGTVSSLNEIHNNSIINRIIKHLYIMLQDYKHLISSDTAAATIQESVNKELAGYFNKVATFEYKCEFKSAYHKAIGLLSHELNIQFFNTIKYQHIILRAMPIA